MIICSLQPSKIEVGKKTAVSLILLNQSSRDCISLTATIKFPYEVGFLSGSRQFKINKLKVNQQQSIVFNLMGETLGSYQISFLSFRYRDGFGNIQSLTNAKLEVEVIAKRPSLPKVEEAEPTPDNSLQQILLAEMPFCFSMEELRTLSFNLNIIYEEVGGTKRTPFVRNLIEYCERRGKLDELKVAVIKERSHLKDKLLP